MRPGDSNSISSNPVEGNRQAWTNTHINGRRRQRASTDTLLIHIA
jgi:hypothetical protein